MTLKNFVPDAPPFPTQPKTVMPSIQEDEAAPISLNLYSTTTKDLNQLVINPLLPLITIIVLEIDLILDPNHVPDPIQDLHAPPTIIIIITTITTKTNLRLPQILHVPTVKAVT